jgi:hypothetical protein
VATTRGTTGNVDFTMRAIWQLITGAFQVGGGFRDKSKTQITGRGLATNL